MNLPEALSCLPHPSGWLLVQAFAAAPDFHYEALFQSAQEDTTVYRKLTSDHVSTFDVQGQQAAKPPTPLQAVHAPPPAVSVSLYPRRC